MCQNHNHHESQNLRKSHKNARERICVTGKAGTGTETNLWKALYNASEIDAFGIKNLSQKIVYQNGAPVNVITFEWDGEGKNL